MNGSHEGLRMMPWLRSNPTEGIMVIPMDRVITVVEAKRRFRCSSILSKIYIF